MPPSPRLTVALAPAPAVALAATQLGLLPDAARLYQAAGRFDLLNRLYRDSGQWERALAIGSKYDRIHLRGTHHAFARNLEACGDLAGAIKHYEAAETALTDVPRMLVAARDTKALAAYVDSSTDKKLHAW